MDSKPSSTSKHQSILLAATDSFAEFGFAKSRIEDIAHRAGVGKGTVYEYFQSKEQLLLQCCIQICKTNEASILSAQSANNEAQINYAQTMHTLIRNVVKIVVGSDKKELRLFIQLWEAADQQADLATEVNTAIQQLYTQWEQIVGELFSAGIEAGAFIDWPDRDMLGKIITAVVDGWIWQKSFRSEIDAENIALRFADTVLSLINNPAAEKSHV